MAAWLLLARHLKALYFGNCYGYITQYLRSQAIQPFI
jgi:hypothetical protein